MKTTIYIKTTFQALHRWLKAPDEVAFLRDYHRHLFHVTVHLRVQELDRELEFFTVKQCLDVLIGRRFVFPSDRSCEHFATDIGLALVAENYPVSKVEVSEDGENGAIVEFAQ